MRTFISISIPENVSKIIQNIQNHLPSEDCKLNIAKNLHLTLKFLGEIDKKQAEQVKQILKTVKFKKFNLELDKIGYFPNKDYIRVVWIGFKDNTQVNQLQKQIDNKLKDLNFSVEKKFHPHITLARVKFIKDKVMFKNEINNIEIDKQTFQITKFKLIKSTLTPKGPVYEDLAEYE